MHIAVIGTESTALQAVDFGIAVPVNGAFMVAMRTGFAATPR